MMRKIVIGMVAAAVMLVATAAPASAASAAPYALLPGQNMDFIVHGTSASLTQFTGVATVGPPTPFLGVFSIVNVKCALTSPVPCSGLLVVL